MAMMFDADYLHNFSAESAKTIAAYYNNGGKEWRLLSYFRYRVLDGNQQQDFTARHLSETRHLPPWLQRFNFWDATSFHRVANEKESSPESRQTHCRYTDAASLYWSDGNCRDWCHHR